MKTLGQHKYVPLGGVQTRSRPKIHRFCVACSVVTVCKRWSLKMPLLRNQCRAYTPLVTQNPFISRLTKEVYLQLKLVIPDSVIPDYIHFPSLYRRTQQNWAGIICMRARINIPEFSLYRIFFCPSHTNFLCPVYPGLTVFVRSARDSTREVRQRGKLNLVRNCGALRLVGLFRHWQHWNIAVCNASSTSSYSQNLTSKLAIYSYKI